MLNHRDNNHYELQNKDGECWITAAHANLHILVLENHVIVESWSNTDLTQDTPIAALLIPNPNA